MSICSYSTWLFNYSLRFIWKGIRPRLLKKCWCQKEDYTKYTYCKFQVYKVGTMCLNASISKAFQKSYVRPFGLFQIVIKISSNAYVITYDLNIGSISMIRTYVFTKEHSSLPTQLLVCLGITLLQCLLVLPSMNRLFRWSVLWKLG